MSVPFIRQFDDFAEAMANPNPDRPIQEAVAAIGRSACDRISARPDLFAPTILQSPLVAACTPYWNAQGYDGPTVNVPFTGGQCAGIEYNITGNVFNPVTGAPNPSNPIFFGTRPGPLTLFVEPGPSGCTPPGRTQDALLIGTVGDRAGAISVRSPGCVEFNTLGNLTVVRQDGLPDTCGNPPGTPAPGPNPAPDPGPLPPGVGPQFDIRGGFIFVLPGAIQINPTLTIELPIGEINLGSGVGGQLPADPLPGNEVAGVGSGNGGGENNFGEPPAGERWVGCCIRITVAPVGAGIIPQSIPHDIYPTIIGNSRLRFTPASGPAQYDTPIAKRQETTCLWEPVRGMAPSGCFVNLLPGYNYAIRPYSVPLEQ